MNKFKKVFALVILICFLFSLFPLYAFSNDLANHWAKDIFQKWIKLGVIKGYPDGNFYPQKPISLAEFVNILDNVFKFIKTSEQQVPYIDQNAWYGKAMSKAIAAGIISINESNIFPNKFLTRQEAALIIYKAFEIEPAKSESIVNKFSDKNLINENTKEAIYALVENGYMIGKSNNKFSPNDYITRAEILKIIDNIIADIKYKPGLYSLKVSGNMLINSSDVRLKNCIIYGDLYIADGVGSGNILLDGVTINGRVVIRGGGENSVVFNNTKVMKSMIITKYDDKVRIVVRGNSNIPVVYVKSGAIIQEIDSNKGIDNVDILDNAKAKEVFMEGNFNLVNAKADNVKIVLSKNTVINSFTSKSSIEINGNGKIVQLNADTKKVKLVDVKVGEEQTVSNISKPAEEKKISESNSITSSVISAQPSNQFQDTTTSNQNQTTTPSSGTLEQLPQSPKFTNVSVHDPSVIKVDNYYYIFGSHLAAAKTSDLMNWELIDSGVKNDSKIIPNVFEELSETFSWAQATTLWAPDVIKLADGKYYMYYCACKGDSPRSALGVAVADKIEGPYKNKAVILKSGMWNEISEDGTIYDATKHPNVVDPNVFFDKNGKLWMVYGSYSGGIFIMQLDPTTGLPLPNQGYGKKLLGGNHSRIEGPYIIYNPNTDYYYLFLSYGGLASDGGYNIRVARSKNPDGPYYDSEGNDMINAKGAEGTFFDDVSIAPYGVKLVGNFIFDTVNNNLNSPGYGYVSPGHNSVYYDKNTGKFFIIFHTRFPGKGEYHEVRVHQLIFNSDGWPVITPSPYVGETAKKVSANDVVGDYLFINHGKDITSTIKKALKIKLNSDGTITGDITGTYEIYNDYYIRLRINESEGQQTNQTIYNGALLKQWDPTTKEYVMTFSALSSKGVSVWGKQLKNNNTLAEIIINNITIPTTVSENIYLPTKAYLSCDVQWESSNPEILSTTGEIVYRPPTKTIVTLTAKINYNGIIKTKSFDVVVTGSEFDPNNDSDLRAYYAFENNLKDATGKFVDGTVTGNKINNTGGNITYVDGKVGKAVYFDGVSGVRLADDLINDYTYTVSFYVYANKFTQHTTAFFGAYNENEWISFVPYGWDYGTILWSGSNPWYDATSSTDLKTNEWTHVAFTVDNGTVKVYINGKKTYEGVSFPDRFSKKPGGVFALGVNWWDTPFNGMIDELRIYDRALSQNEIAVLAGLNTGEQNTANNPIGLVAHFAFENDLTDSTGHFSSGSVIGNKIGIDGGTVSYADGKKGKSFVFDGNSGVLLPKGLISSHIYTVSLWVYAEQLTDCTTTFFGARDGNSWVSVVPRGHTFVNNDTMVWSGSNWYDAGTGMKINVNQWYHIAFKVNNGAIDVYINGERKFSGNNFPDIFINNECTFSLAVNWWDTPFKGMIDELRIYDIALTDEQILELSR